MLVGNANPHALIIQRFEGRLASTQYTLGLEEMEQPSGWP